MTVEIRSLGLGDEDILHNIAPGVFDNQVDESLSAEFLADPRHHLAIAIESDLVVGFASALHYVHPDKPSELWINEVGVAPTHQRQGIGKKLLQKLLKIAHSLGCHEAWVLTERSNPVAMRLYESVGGTEAPDDVVMFNFQLKEESTS
ncbi:MAG: GNAT family N-acetyltransferase [Cyanobacteria bacterium P01_A01_bin.45]